MAFTEGLVTIILAYFCEQATDPAKLSGQTLTGSFPEPPAIAVFDFAD